MRAIWSLGVVLVCSTVMVAQAPPIKMGLWESNTVMDNGDGSPVKGKMRNCITPEEWQKVVQGTVPQRPGCKNSIAKTANGYSMDVNCSSPKMTIVMHGTTRIVDAEHTQSEMHMKETFQGKVNNVVTRSDGHFVSASCGAVKPGHPQDVE